MSASFGIKLGGDRSSIIHDVSAGSAIDEIIIIENPDAETTINLFPVDQVKSTDGTYIPKSQYEKMSLFGEWIGPPVTLTLAAQTAYPYSFTISVPKDMVNGTYYGAILFHEIPKIVGEGNLKITSTVGMRIKITVTGGLTSAKVNTKQTLVEDAAPVVPVQDAVQTKPVSPQPAPISPAPSSLILEGSSSLAPMHAIPDVTPSEDQSLDGVPAFQEDSSTAKKYDAWGSIKIFVLAVAFLLVLFLIAWKT